MNRFVIVDGFPYLLSNGKAYAVRFDADGLTVGEMVDKTVSPYPLYTATEIKAKCAFLDSIGEQPDEEQPLTKMTLDELKEYAKENDIELGSAKTKNAIIEVIKASVEQAVT